MDNMKVGLYIKRKIKEKCITQEQLAEEMNISSSAVSQVLSGKNMFDVMNPQVLSRILDEPIDVILNSGEEPETALEILAKKSVDDYKKTDPRLEMGMEKDHKGNTLFEYIIRHNNINLIRLFGQKIMTAYANDIRLATILIKHEDTQLLEQLYNNFQFTKKVNFGREITEFSKDTKKHTDYSLDELKYYEVLSKCKNEKIYEITGCLRINQSNINYFSAFLYFAIFYDQAHILKYDHEQRFSNQNHNSGQNLTHIINTKYSKILRAAIDHKSMNCIEYCYNMLSHFNLQNYFTDLINTKNKAFIQEFIERFKDKTNDRYQSNVDNGRFNNADSLRTLIESNNIEILEYSIEFSNQEALDEALFATRGDQIEIIKLLILKGARFMYLDTYSGSRKLVLEPLSSMVKYLFEELNKKSKKHD